jgi:hypothetical protein
LHVFFLRSLLLLRAFSRTDWWPYYPFDGNATDKSGVGDNGTLVGNAQYGPGIKGLGIVLDGSGSGVQLGNPTNLWLQNLSIVSWVKRASSSVISYGSGGVGTI